MGTISFNNYARLADSNLTPTEIAGRYAIQEEAERRIPADVAGKLDLQVSDSLLEVGCGIGKILLPLSDQVTTAAGIDHPTVLRKLKERAPEQPIKPIGGNFLDLDVHACFDKVLVYSVLHCLTNVAEAELFAAKALSLVRPGGRLLLGDIPNRDLKARFLASAKGAAFQKEWQAALESSGRQSRAMPALDDDPHTASFGDREVLALLAWFRGEGHEAYVLPQPPDLPFGHTREDILIMRKDS
jgi:SAM-dependent methyltransferase